MSKVVIYRTVKTHYFKTKSDKINMKDFLFKKLPLKSDSSFRDNLDILRADWNEINRSILKFEPLKINHTQIKNTYEFIEFQFELLEANSDNKDYLPLLKRLSDLLFDIWVAELTEEDMPPFRYK